MVKVQVSSQAQKYLAWSGWLSVNSYQVHFTTPVRSFGYFSVTVFKYGAVLRHIFRGDGASEASKALRRKIVAVKQTKITFLS